MKMSNENENLDELLSSFYDERKTNEFKNNLKSFEDMFDDSPVPSSQTIDSIKNAVAKKLLSSRHRNRIFTFRRIAVAAIILLIVLVEINMDSRQPEMPEVVISNITYDLFDESETSQIASLTEQIEQIEDALLSVRLDEYDTYTGDSYLELETVLSEINGNFWKG